MITEQDLQAAIAECQGQRNPTSSTCIKLASFLTIQDHLYGKKEEMPKYSFASGTSKIQYNGDSEFAKLVNGREQYEVFAVLDELMETLNVINPRLYASVIRKLQ